MLSGMKALNVTFLLCALVLSHKEQRKQDSKPSILLTPDAPELIRHAPDHFHVRFETSEGVIRLEIHRQQASCGRSSSVEPSLGLWKLNGTREVRSANAAALAVMSTSMYCAQDTCS